MREIKFRVWDNLMKKYVSRCEMTDITLNFYGDQQCCSLSDMVFQQYTGLKDKSGVEIYEGDVIKYHRVFESKKEVIELTSCIKFQNGAFGFDMKGFNDMFMSLGDDSDIEVIGNIFENNELLEA
jgi:uncharacterized phage protein (TIGR01671 family)